MITIIADNQHIAKRFARIVGASDECTFQFFGNNYAVTWLDGIDLGFSPEITHTLDALPLTECPLIPEKFPVVLLPQKGQQKPIEKMLNHARILSELIADSTYVYLATSDLNATLLKGGPFLATVPKGFLYHLHLRSLSAKGIRESINHRLLLRGVQQKYEQVLKREKADWLVSANATHLVEKVYGKGTHHLDRIATPMLSLICGRYKANKEHQPRATYQVNFSVERSGEVYKFTSDEQFTDVAEANALYVKMRSAMGDKPAVISRVAVRTSPLASPKPFDYHSMLLAANGRFGFGVIHTTECLQRLFDLGLITWPFTDKDYIGENYAREFWNNTIYDLRSNARWERMIGKIDKPGKNNVLHGNKKREHVGICLTERKCNPDVFKLTKDEQAIYNLIVEQTILAFAEDAQTVTSQVCALFDGHPFTVEKCAVKEKGWTAMIGQDLGNTDNPWIPYHWKEKEKMFFFGVSITKKVSQPVRLHTAETLLMEAGLFDLGTEKEKADAVRTLFEQGYIDTFEKDIIPTEKGLALYGIIRDMIIASPKYMGCLNRHLAQGEYNKAMIRDYTEAITRELLASDTLFAKRALPVNQEAQEIIDYIKQKAS